MSYYSENIINESESNTLESNTLKINDINNFNIDNCEQFDINELKNLKNNLSKLKYDYQKKEKLCESNIETINQLICNKCFQENNGHIWTSYREPCMYGEKYHYCKNCGKDMYSQAMFDLSSFN